jgi:hypothetical protein
MLSAFLGLILALALGLMFSLSVVAFNDCAAAGPHCSLCD